MKLRLPWMSRSDRRAWQSAVTLADLGELMALWLEGTLRSQPDYQPNWGPDEETELLVPTLAACNRVGFLTTCSQPGEPPLTGADGSVREQQRAAVEGFVADPVVLARLVEAAEAAGLLVILSDRLDGAQNGVVATVDGGEPFTWFGRYPDEEQLRAMWPVVSQAAQDSVVDAVQVTIVDRQWGRNDVLWPVLDSVAAQLPELLVGDVENEEAVRGLVGRPTDSTSSIPVTTIQKANPMTEVTEIAEIAEIIRYTADVVCIRGSDVLLIERGWPPHQGRLALTGVRAGSLRG